MAADDLLGRVSDGPAEILVGRHDGAVRGELDHGLGEIECLLQALRAQFGFFQAVRIFFGALCRCVAQDLERLRGLEIYASPLMRR